MSGNSELEQWIAKFREAAQSIQQTVTPEFVRSLEPAQVAWLQEHLEMLIESEKALVAKIEARLKESHAPRED